MFYNGRGQTEKCYFYKYQPSHFFDLPHPSGVLKVVTKYKPLTCPFGPLPTELVIISAFTHFSMSSVIVSTPYKTSAISTILKIPGLNLNNLNNFCPIFHPLITSKFLEKSVASQLHAHRSPNRQNKILSDFCPGTTLTQLCLKSQITFSWHLLLVDNNPLCSMLAYDYYYDDDD